MTFPDDQEVEAMTQCTKEVRKHKKVANKSNRSARGRVDSPLLAGSERVRNSMANTIVPDERKKQ